jgi:hypothetical protein
LGLLLRGAEVRIVGQSEDGGWLQIEYPVHSNLRGWVIVGSLEVQGDLAGVPIATPESLPLADVPTYEAVPTEWIDVTTTPESAITETSTSTPSPAADLVVGGSLVSGGILVVTVTNQAQARYPAAQSKSPCSTTPARRY